MADSIGFLSRNQKRDSDRHPELRGNATIEGVEYWLSAWVKENDHGKYFKIAFTPKDTQRSAGEENQAPPSDDIPF